MKGDFSPQRPALYAKVFYCFKSRVKRKSNFSIKKRGVEEKKPLSYTEQFLFVLSFNVTPYFRLKKVSYYY